MSFRSTQTRSIAFVVLTAAWSAPAAAQTTHTVTLEAMRFIPENLTVDVGDTVHWVWVSGFHNVESGVVVNGAGVHDGNFLSGTPDFDLTFDLTFDQPFLDGNPIPNDVYPYFCIVHASVNMVGTITAQATGGCTADSECDDGDDCNGMESCVLGDCLAGSPLDCDDGDVCNGVETCQSGACVAGASLECDDSNPCTDDSCHPVFGCRNIPDDGNPCTDGDPCTENACINGSCVGTVVPGCSPCSSDSDCNDADLCTDDRCSGIVCVNTFNIAPCDDGDVCTVIDTCTNGVCTGSPILGCCQTDAACDDGDSCTATVCVHNACMTTLIEDCVPCLSDGECDDDNVCTDDRCDLGVCAYADNSVVCDDGDPCTESDVCAGGSCAGAGIEECCRTDSDCDDGDVCTADMCSDDVCEHIAVEGCGDDNGDAGDAPPGDDGTATPPTSRRRLCGVVGMMACMGTLLGLGVMRMGGRRLRERAHAGCGRK